MKLSLFAGVVRAPFLLLAVVSVLVGYGAAVTHAPAINPFHLALVMLGALCAHISVNALNEYLDFKSGLDLKTNKTPFSGGSGTLPANPDFAHGALLIATISLAITLLVGSFFVATQGIMLLPMGLAGVLLIILYTQWITRYPLLCLVAPGLGFGPIMVMGTEFALTGIYTPVSFTASLVLFFLTNNLLLLNQYPDIEPDRTVGRKHVLIKWGKRAGAWLYLLFALLAFASILASVLLGLLPATVLVAMIMLAAAIPVMYKVLRNVEDTENLQQLLGRNVAISLVTPALVFAGLVI
jgi:1,4-dihydroxy-2-naphthoate octaprenyltransferase